MRTLFLANHISPMNGPLISNGGLLVEDDVILAIGPRARLGRSDAVEDLGNVVLIPGLINAHVHLELTGLGQLPRPASFVDWVLSLRARMHAQRNLESFLRQSTQAGIEQCLRFGITTVGDITANPGVVRPLLARSPLRGISFGEVLGMAGRSAQFEPRLLAAIDASSLRSSRFQTGIEPHAPYSLDLKFYARCVAAARERSMPLTTHLAETPDEAEFLARSTGEFGRLWAALAEKLDDATRRTGGPIRAMNELALLSMPTLLAHVNYADDEELALLAKGRACVVYCPRTHAYFGHRPHRWREMLARGIEVAVGTDSAASSPDLNVVDDLRLLHALHPDVEVGELWSLVTVRAARTMGMQDQIGELSPGKKADFCAFPAGSEDPLRTVLQSNVACAGTWIGGVRVQ